MQNNNNKKTLISSILILIVLGAVLYFSYSSRKNTAEITPEPNITSTIYKNNDYGFTFTLPTTWEGYSIIKDTWTGTPLKDTAAQNGPKLLIRNPEWTEAAPYEDLPILVFTIPQWDAYLAESFSVSAAPIPATELARNNMYVFALPPRWNFDYSLGYKEAETIMEGKPLSTFTVGASSMPSGKLNINLVCEKATETMRFMDQKSKDAFISGCIDGKNPEVIEKYKADMNLGAGAAI
jgi:hypothetical protein